MSLGRGLAAAPSAAAPSDASRRRARRGRSAGLWREDVSPASRCAEFALGNRGERVAAAYGDDAMAPLRPIIQIRNLESPADLQPVGRQSAPWVRGRDLAPLSAISVVPLGQAPEIITCLHHVMRSCHRPARPECRRARECVTASIGSMINVAGSGGRGTAATWRSESGSAWTACGTEIIVITEINSPAANRCGASRPGRRIRMRCRK